jgi:hypothetical protein
MTLNSTSKSLLDTHSPICHPDRSEAEWRDLLFHSIGNQHRWNHDSELH